MRLVLFLTALLSMFSLNAYNIFKDRCWELGGSFLYWTPFGKSYLYAQNTVTNSTTTYSLRPDYHPAFRLFGATYKTDCCHLFSTEWVHFRSTDTISAAATTASLKYGYDKVNIRAGRYVSAHCESLGYVFGGLRYLYLERLQKASSPPSQVVTRSFQSSRFSGAGLELGYGVEVQEPCNFSLVGQFCGVMAVGERRLRQTTIFSTTPNRTSYPTQADWICGLELRLGARYRYLCKCYWIDVELGFEMDQYFNALSLANPSFLAGPPRSQVTNTIVNDVNVGFAGPYLAASIRF